MAYRFLSFDIVFPIALGLAWTAVGGEIMFVEAICMSGTGELILTGQLGMLSLNLILLLCIYVHIYYIRAHIHTMLACIPYN